MAISNRNMGILLFIAGLAVGANYTKIRKQLKPAMKNLGKKSTEAYAAVAKFLATQKEHVEDLMAKAKKAKKVKAKKRVKVAAKA